MEPAPWQQWFDEHGACLLLYARQLAFDVAEAEDAVQEAFVRVWRTWRQRQDPRAALFVAVRRAVIDLGRRRQRRQRREAVYATERHLREPAWFTPDGRGGEGTELQEALRRLPEPQREVVVLKIWGDQTFGQIGKVLGVSPNTAASRYRLALRALRSELRREASNG